MYVNALLVVSSLLFALIFGALGQRALSRWRERRRGRKAQARGARAERRAPRLLERSGYQVLDEQVEGGYALRVDGELRPVKVRADLLVQRGGETFVVEVKTGASARPTARSTRRQLLEYHHAFSADGLILADVERDALHVVSFDAASSDADGGARFAGTWLVWTALALAVALALLAALTTR